MMTHRRHDAARLARRMLAAIVVSGLVVAPASAQERVRDRWQFKFRKFVIGAWWRPDATDAEMRSYRDAGFNVVMSGRYMQMADYGNAAKALKELDLARRYGLGVLYDTYTKNDRPWGGKADPYEPHPVHHPATLTELRWLHERIGRHPALIGYMIGDDQGEVGPRSKACTDFLFATKPHLIPWLCGWIDPTNLAANNNPMANPQIYPTLYEWGLPADDLAQRYCAAYAGYSRKCREAGVAFWPMFNAQGALGKQERDMDGCMPSDSLLRLPAYAALAYGAEGIWYFCYNGGSLQHIGPHRTALEAAGARTPLYPIAQKINRRIAHWGPMVMGRACSGLFGTAFRTETAWPFAEDGPPYGQAEDLATPSPGKLVESMDADLIAGVLVRPGKHPLVMVVDCRVDKALGTLPPREVTLCFGPGVRRVRILEPGRHTAVKGKIVRFPIEAGGGQMLELEGSGLESVTARRAIYAPISGTKPQAPPEARVADLSNATAAKLRIDVFGSNGGTYADKWVMLNGVKIGRVPITNRDQWVVAALDLTPEHMRSLRATNQVTITNEGRDAWKFRNLALAIRRADGTWARSRVVTGVYSSPNWALSEGLPIAGNAEAGPITIDLAP